MYASPTWHIIANCWVILHSTTREQLLMMIDAPLMTSQVIKNSVLFMSLFQFLKWKWWILLTAIIMGIALRIMKYWWNWYTSLNAQCEHIVMSWITYHIYNIKNLLITTCAKMQMFFPQCWLRRHDKVESMPRQLMACKLFLHLFR